MNLNPTALEAGRTYLVRTPKLDLDALAVLRHELDLVRLDVECRFLLIEDDLTVTDAPPFVDGLLDELHDALAGRELARRVAVTLEQEVDDLERRLDEARAELDTVRELR